MRQSINPNDLDGNGVDDRMQANLQPQPGQNQTSQAQGPQAQNQGLNQPNPQQQAQQQRANDPLRQQQKAAQRVAQQQQQQQMVKRTAERQIRAMQTNPNAQAQRGSLFNSFSSSVNKLINRKQQTMAAPVQPTPQNQGQNQAGFAAPSATAMPSSSSMVPRSASVNPQPPMAADNFDPTAPGTYLPPKPGAGKTRGV